MINHLDLRRAACFNASTTAEIELKAVNFIYGPNGSGKSTIAKLAASEARSVTGEDNVFLYNRGYREAIITQSDKLKGLLTLGADANDARRNIEKYKKDIDAAVKRRESAKTQISGETGLESDIQTLNKKIRQIIWNVRKKKIPADLITKMFPRSGTKQNLQEKYQPVIKEVEDEYRLISDPTSGKKFLGRSLRDCLDRFQMLSALEGEPTEKVEVDYQLSNGYLKQIAQLLDDEIRNNADSDYAEYLSKMQEDQWFKKGIELLKKESPCCPMCRTNLSEEEVEEIISSFSNEYDEKIAAIEQYKGEVQELIDRIKQTKTELEDKPGLDFKPLRLALSNYIEILEELGDLLERKLKTPSSRMSLPGVSEAATEVGESVRVANTEISALNDDAKNRADSLKQLEEESYKALIYLCWEPIEQHLNDIRGKYRGIEALKGVIKSNQDAIGELENSIEQEARRVSNTKVPCDRINSLLEYLIGDAFKLVEADPKQVESNYRVVRQDGTAVQDDLSEGEEQILAFLYFISRVRSQSELQAGDAESHLTVVIDDPMSSLDSELLFGVASMIVDMVKTAADDKSQIEQFLCLTHNATFYNAVAYNFRVSNGKIGHYLIEKIQHGFHEVTALNKAPVTNVYRELWSEVHKASTRQTSPVSLANVMRRILENYFDAGNSLSALRDHVRLNEQDKIAINSLIIWANDGSHNLMDSFEVGMAQVSTDAFLRVFKLIFEEMGHLAHYQMMLESAAQEQ